MNWVVCLFLLRICWWFELMLNANFSGFFVVIISISVIFVANNERKREKKRPSILQQFTNAIFLSQMQLEKNSMKSQLSRIDDDKLVSHGWHLFCPQNFKVNSTKQHTEKIKSWRFHSKHQVFFFNFSTFLFADYLFFFNIIITLVCYGAQKRWCDQSERE